MTDTKTTIGQFLLLVWIAAILVTSYGSALLCAVFRDNFTCNTCLGSTFAGCVTIGVIVWGLAACQ